MGNRFADGKRAISECDICGFRFKLKNLKQLVIKTKNVNILACPECWNPDQPQLQLGMYPVDDPQALRNPRPDLSYRQAGYNGLQLNDSNTEEGFGGPTQGSRVIQWGWNPVGLDNALDIPNIPNNLVAAGEVGTVTVIT